MLPARKRRRKTALPHTALLCLAVLSLTVGPWAAKSATSVAPADPKDAEGRQELAVADALRATWTAGSLRQAIDHYDKAAVAWSAISDFRSASEAKLKAGNIHFLLSEYPQAHLQYESAQSLAQQSGDWLAEAKVLSQMGRLQANIGKNDLAQEHSNQSLALFKHHDVKSSVEVANAYGEALGSQAEVSYSRGDFLNASKQLAGALAAFQDDAEGEARAHLFNGYIAGTIGDTNRAAAELARALQLYREINHKSGEGLALTAIGLLHAFTQDYDRAIALHNQALAIFAAIGDQHSEAVALNAMGQGYEALREHGNAITYFERALEIFQKIGAGDAVAGTTCAIASVQLLDRNPEQALADFKRCAQLSHGSGNLRSEALAVEGIAQAYGAQGYQQLASRQYQELETFFQRIGDLRGQAMALNSHGDFLLQNGKEQKALDHFGQAYALTEKIDDKAMLTTTLYNLARANEALGYHDAALSLINKSFELIEQIRQKVDSPDFRASFFAAVKRHYDLCMQILMQLDRRRPGQGFDAQAFAVSEQSRARLLLDLLSESRANSRASAAGELVQQEVTLRGLLRAQAQYRLSLSLSEKDPAKLAEVSDQVAQLRAQYQTVLAQLREQNPGLFSFEKFTPADVPQIQKELAGSDTMLLEYALGDEQSYLWAITANSLDSFMLPARNVIAAAAAEYLKALTARQGGAGESYQSDVAAADTIYAGKANNLSRMLFGPVLDKLGTRRLLIVADATLQDIPFEALPTQTMNPAGPETNLLIDTHEVSMLPSASTLIALRGKADHESSSGKLVAIIADPVFNADDERLQRQAPTAVTVAAASGEQTAADEQRPLKSVKLGRLTHASEEAEAITAIAPWGTTLVAEGFEASREMAMSPEFSQAKIVHFATHGYLDSEHPELSAMVLTMKDRNGANVNGLMSLPDIYGLNMSADLVVLSACQSGLGKDINGEGLVGLTHSFMSAGAKTVVASLWKVDDRASAALMADFYDGMLQKGMPPAAALRAAKLKMMKVKQWRAPYYWAGFVLQGEYTNRIAVEHYSWLRFRLLFLLLPLLLVAAVLVVRKRKRLIRAAQIT